MAIERAASIVGLQSTVFTKGVLMVYREVVDGSQQCREHRLGERHTVGVGGAESA